MIKQMPSPRVYNFLDTLYGLLHITVVLTICGIFYWLFSLIPKTPIPPEIEAYNRANEKYLIATVLVALACGSLIKWLWETRQSKQQQQSSEQKQALLRQQLREEEAVYQTSKALPTQGRAALVNRRNSHQPIYYHVMVKMSGYPVKGLIGSTYERRDLTGEEVLDQYVRPYSENRSLYMYELELPAPASPDRQRQLLVFCTGSEFSGVFCDRHEKNHPELAQALRIRTIELCCDDILNDLLPAAQSVLGVGQSTILGKSTVQDPVQQRLGR